MVMPQIPVKKLPFNFDDYRKLLQGLRQPPAPVSAAVTPTQTLPTTTLPNISPPTPAPSLKQQVHKGIIDTFAKPVNFNTGNVTPLAKQYTIQAKTPDRYPNPIEGFPTDKQIASGVMTGTNTVINYAKEPRTVAETIGESVRQFPAQIELQKGWQGANALNPNKDIKAAETRQKEFETRTALRSPAALGISKIAPSMTSSLVAGAAGTLAAGLTYIATGANPVTATGPAALAAKLTGSGVSGAMMYQTTTYQIMQQYLEAKNEESIAKLGRPMTPQEQEQYRQDFSSKAKQYGLWESIPEAVGNYVFGSTIVSKLGKAMEATAGASIGKRIMTNVFGGAAEVYGTELATETVTQKGQSAIEAEAGLRDGKISWVQAFKEVFPQTVLQTTLMVGAGQIGTASYVKIAELAKKEAKTKGVTEDSPVLTGMNEQSLVELISQITGQVPQTAQARMGVVNQLGAEGQQPTAKVSQNVPTTPAATPQGEFYQKDIDLQNNTKKGEAIKNSRLGDVDLERAYQRSKSLPTGQIVENTAGMQFKLISDSKGRRTWMTQDEDGQWGNPYAEEDSNLGKNLVARSINVNPTATPTPPVTQTPMTPSTSAQGNMLGQPAQSQMLGEVSGKESGKVPLTQPPVKGTELPGQISFASVVGKLNKGEALTTPEELAKENELRSIFENPTPAQKEALDLVDSEKVAQNLDEMQAEEKRLMEIEGRKAFNETQEWAKKTFLYGTRITGKKTGVRSEVPKTLRFVDLVSEGNQLDYTTYSKAKAIDPHTNYSKYNDKKNHPKFFNKVPLDDILDQYASEFGFADADAFREAIIQLKKVSAGVTQQPPSEPPITPTTLTTGGEEEFSIKNYTDEAINALAGAFTDYLASPTLANQTKLAKLQQKRELARRLVEFNIRSESLQAAGKSFEQAEKQALTDTMSGKLTNDQAIQDFTDDMRDVLFEKVKRFFRNKPNETLERISTEEALTNLLATGRLPGKVGTGTETFPEGGSARLRLERVFGGGKVQEPKITITEGQPVIPQEPLSDIITEIEKQKKPLKDIVDGVIRKPGQPPIPVDEGIADYLRNLPNEVRRERFGAISEPQPVQQLTLGAEIDNIFKQHPLINDMEKSAIVKVLKEIAWSPVDIGNGIRGILASMDFSAFRTGRKLGSGDPVSMYQATLLNFTSTFSQKVADAAWTAVARNPKMELYEEIRREHGFDPLRSPSNIKGISRNRLAEEFGFNNEERFLQKLFAKVPWMKQSNRGFVSSLNKIVWDSWEKHYDSVVANNLKVASGELKPSKVIDVKKEMSQWQSYLGDMIQRANLGRLDKASPIISGLFFAPKARIANLIVGRHLFSSNPRIARNAWRSLGTWIATTAGIILLGEALGLWDVEKDPRSGQAWTVRIGNVHIDPWEGQRSIVTFYSRIITGMSRSAVTGQKRAIDVMSALADFTRSSMSPMAGFITDLKMGKTFIGDKTDLANIQQDIGRVAPMALYSIWQTFQEDWKLGLAISPLSLLGENVNTYDSPETVIPADILKLGRPDQVAQDSALKSAVSSGASASKIAEIQGKQTIYDTASLARDIAKSSSPDRNQGLPPIAVDYWGFATQKKTYDALSTKEQEAYLKTNPGFTTQRLFWGDSGLTTIPDLKTAQELVTMAEKYGIKLDMIQAFQKTDKGFERIPSDKTIWPSYFQYYDVPGRGGYLDYTQKQVDAGKLPPQYQTTWETYQKLTTDLARTYFRKSHPVESKDMRTDLRRKNPVLDKWLVDNEYNQPLAKLTSKRIASSSISNKLFSTGGGSRTSAAPRRTSKALPKFKKIRVKTGMKIKAPSGKG